MSACKLEPASDVPMHSAVGRPQCMISNILKSLCIVHSNSDTCTSLDDRFSDVDPCQAALIVLKARDSCFRDAPRDSQACKTIDRAL